VHLTTSRAAGVLILAASTLVFATACKDVNPRGTVSKRIRSHDCIFTCSSRYSLVIRSSHHETTIEVPKEVWRGCPPKATYPACKSRKKMI